MYNVLYILAQVLDVGNSKRTPLRGTIRWFFYFLKLHIFHFTRFYSGGRVILIKDTGVAYLFLSSVIKTQSTV